MDGHNSSRTRNQLALPGFRKGSEMSNTTIYHRRAFMQAKAICEAGLCFSVLVDLARPTKGDPGDEEQDYNLGGHD